MFTACIANITMTIAHTVTLKTTLFLTKNHLFFSDDSIIQKFPSRVNDKRFLAKTSLLSKKLDKNRFFALRTIDSA